MRQKIQSSEVKSEHKGLGIAVEGAQKMKRRGKQQALRDKWEQRTRRRPAYGERKRKKRTKKESRREEKKKARTRKAA